DVRGCKGPASEADDGERCQSDPGPSSFLHSGLLGNGSSGSALGLYKRRRVRRVLSSRGSCSFLIERRSGAMYIWSNITSSPEGPIMPTVSPTPPADPSTALADRPREILDAFQGNIQPVTSSASYRLGILLVAVVMVLLPLLYVALIGLTAYGVYYHAVNHT